jgi:hypothetical protein
MACVTVYLSRSSCDGNKAERWHASQFADVPLQRLQRYPCATTTTIAQPGHVVYMSAASYPWAVLAACLNQTLHNACVDLQQQAHRRQVHH